MGLATSSSTISKRWPSLLRAAGLVNVVRRAPFETGVAHFRGKDRVDAWRNAMTLYVEAEAPQCRPERRRMAIQR